MDEPTRRRHRVIGVEVGGPIVVTACRQRIANIGQRHPDTPGHLIAYPKCPCRQTVTPCEGCG